MVHVFQVRVLEDTFDVQSFFLVFLKASVYKILQLRRPSFSVNLSVMLILNRFIERVVFQSSKRRVAGCKFKSIAPVAPDVNLFGVGLSSHDFGADPIWSASSRFSLLDRVREERAEAQVSDTDFTLRIAQNVVAFDIPM